MKYIFKLFLLGAIMAFAMTPTVKAADGTFEDTFMKICLAGEDAKRLISEQDMVAYCTCGLSPMQVLWEAGLLTPPNPSITNLIGYIKQTCLQLYMGERT